jgi:hypothetical protein
MSKELILVVVPSVVTILIAIAGGIFSVVQWYDIRRREQKQRRWADYTALLAAVGGAANVPGQLGALYQLVEYTEFRTISARSLKASNDIMKKMNNTNWVSYLSPRVNEVISELEKL